MDAFIRNVPSLKWLLTFRIVAQHLSFTRAAAYLNVTQPAVSRQILLLEERLGVRLFNRKGRTVRLTPEGEHFRDAVELGFGHINHMVEVIQQMQSEPHVTIQTDAEFASFWLLPVIKTFNRHNPRITTSILSSYDVLDYKALGIDLGILFGDGNWPDVSCTRLFHEVVFPVCSPDYLKRHPHLTTIDQLNDLTLLGWDRSLWAFMDWNEWFLRKGLTLRPGRQKLKFNDYTVAIQAAVNGQGIALAWSYCIGDLLATGKLVRPLAESVITQRGQFLVAPKALPMSEATKRLYDWILEQARAESSAPPVAHPIQQSRS